MPSLDGTLEVIVEVAQGSECKIGDRNFHLTDSGLGAYETAVTALTGSLNSEANA